jgi:hypothetical protein
MEIHTIGIDLAKTIFHLVGVNARGKSWCARSVRAFRCCASQLTFACA